MEEPLTIDSGEGTMEHSMHHHHQPPQPPPRFESYSINGTYRHNFDKMSNRSVNSLDGMEESVKYGNTQDERQTYSNMYFYEENNSDLDKDDHRNRNLGQGEFLNEFLFLNGIIIDIKIHYLCHKVFKYFHHQQLHQSLHPQIIY